VGPKEEDWSERCNAKEERLDGVGIDASKRKHDIVLVVDLVDILVEKLGVQQPMQEIPCNQRKRNRKQMLK
jgi:hypothetical protein